MRREWLFVLLAIGFAALAGLVIYFYRPTMLTVAVGPRDGVEANLIETYARALNRTREDVRLRVVPFDDVRDSAAALEQGRADLAVVRPDVKLPDNGLTLAILHDEALIVAAPEAAEIESFSDLSTRRLGVVTRHVADLPVLTSLLDFYDFKAASEDEASSDQPLATGRVGLVPLKTSEITQALESKRVDAVAIIASPTGKPAQAMLRAVELASAERKLTLVSVPDGKAIIQRMPTLQAVTLSAGTFGGRPKRPAEDVETVGVSYRLMARGAVSRVAVASVVQHLFEWRSRLAAAAPVAHQMKPPEYDTTVTATSAQLPNHPGAVDYFEREQQTFLDRYEDWIYLFAFFGGTLGSGVAWLGQRLARKRRERIDIILDRLLDILAEAREAQSAAALDALTRETDALITDVVRQARERSIDSRMISALILAIDAVNGALDDGRRAFEPDTAPGAGERRARTARLLSLSLPAAE
ncbi:MAG TPA: C4-dicarboxylate ABC transporter substrate-binding protein [Methylorubrum populi]|uniref:C4-dicarboxylate ABC transporter substrate-binding protein n=1 Tax=Methylorubrum populi TaxID=223967 RepID=A0A921JFM5_9HYPH|nr:C4-dicarboxylate ABC transporter substrate-binding protein [Methylorubrum populi]